MGALLIACAPLFLDWALDWRFHQTPPTPKPLASASRGDANRQDLDYIGKLPQYDRSFSPEARARFEHRLAALKAQADTLTQPQLLMGIAELAALADNGHTNASMGGRGRLFNSVALRFAWLADGWYVVRAAPAYANLLGGHVLAIDGVDVEAWHRDCARYIGGTDEHARSWEPLLLQSPDALHVMRPDAPEHRLTLRLRFPDDREETAEVVAEPPSLERMVEVPGRYLSPLPLEDEPAGWRTILDRNVPPPVSLRGVGRSFYTTTLRDGSVLYLHLWNVFDDQEGALASQIIAAVDARSSPWRTIVLDLRFDSGGDYTTAYRGVRRLVERLAPDGKLFILTDHATFSAALVVAAWAKYYAGARTTIVGEQLGDRTNFFAEGERFVLPNGKQGVSIATGYHDWGGGRCSAHPDCYWPNYFYDVPAGDLSPRIMVGWRFDDYRRSIDTVLERALAEAAP